MNTTPKLLILAPRSKPYPRNNVLVRAFQSHFSATEQIVEERIFGKIKTFFFLIANGRKFDAILLLHPAIRFAIPLWLARPFVSATLIGDAFISEYDTLISDRKLASRKSIRAFFYRMLDKLFVRSCDILLFDTPEHEGYFRRTCGLKKNTRSFIAPISIDTEEFKKVTPQFPARIEQNKKEKAVIFFGNYVPLQGIEYVIDAIEALKHRTDIRFFMVGNGQTKNMIVDRAKEKYLERLTLIERMEHEPLMAFVKASDLALGIFGGSEKAQRVIPNKLLEAMALGVPVLTGRNIPSERYFKEGKHVHYARLGDGKDIARAIEGALRDPAESHMIAEEGRQVIERNFSLNALTAGPVKDVADIVTGSAGTLKESTSPPRIVVYTSVFGNRDILRDPLVRPKNCDFVCFTDQPFRSRVWEIRRVKPPVPGDLTRSNRHYKFFPHTYFPDHEISLYVDGNMRLLDDPSALAELYLKDAHIALFSHMGNIGDQRDTIKEEVDALMRMQAKGKRKEDLPLMRGQVAAYLKEGFPDKDLIAGMVLLRKHHKEDVMVAMDLWWDELTRWSKRDQLSFNYVAWRSGLSFATIPGDSTNGPYFYRHGHYKRRGPLWLLRQWAIDRFFDWGFV